MDSSHTRFICIHGHFYQPPRENPWLGEIERQESAHPWHDWNQRINAECYWPNTQARILDSEGRLAHIVNNYEHISFDVGPTLLAWMEKHATETYRAILDADAVSRTRRSGHGNALAQAYHHMIMPLASHRDKITQVVWGIEDFAKRFGRDPEGMWLPETAVDTETLDVLARHGMRFTILAPRQAARFRASPKDEWGSLDPGTIDPTRPYLCRLPRGRSITLFFYEGSISVAIAFQRLLNSGEDLKKRLLAGFSRTRPWPQLMHVASDGESYGHHHRFGEMALAYALKGLQEEPNLRLTNYGEFLETHPPVAEVEIVEKSSWSCAHGVGRWSDDCGCRLTDRTGWNQKWRAPLRTAMDLLRDRADKIFARKATGLLKDCWKARNDYIHVILGSTSIPRFLARHQARKLKGRERLLVLSLLEMEHNRMPIYTSCGWFFDDISGIESLQVLAYAARVIQLAAPFDRTLRGDFLSELAHARSNKSPHQGADEIFKKRVVSQMVDLARVAAHVAILSAFEDVPIQARVHRYEIRAHKSVRETSGERLLAICHMSVKDSTISERRDFAVAMLYLAGVDFRCSVKELKSGPAYDTLADDITSSFGRNAATEVIRKLDKYFPGDYFTLRDLFVEQRTALIDTITRKMYEEQAGLFEAFYHKNKDIARFVRENDSPLPDTFLASARFVLNRAFLDELDRLVSGAFPDKLDAVLEEAQYWNINPDISSAERLIRYRILDLVRRLGLNPGDETVADEIVRFLDICRDHEIPIQLGDAQILFFKILQSIPAEERSALSSGIVSLADRLSVRIA